MAEYYPLLAKAVGSLPNSTPEVRRVVYERARKALIGQLRTLHPPVPDEDIERESVELDRAIERLESELAGAPSPAPATLPPPPVADEAAPKRKPASVLPARGAVPPSGGSLGPPARNPPIPALRTKLPVQKPAAALAPPPAVAPPPPAIATPPAVASPPPSSPQPAEKRSRQVPRRLRPCQQLRCRCWCRRISRMRLR